MEPRYNEGPTDWQILFAIMRFRYIEVLFHIFYYYWGEENRSLYRGLRYIEARYIEVPLWYMAKTRRPLTLQVYLPYPTPKQKVLDSRLYKR